MNKKYSVSVLTKFLYNVNILNVEEHRITLSNPDIIMEIGFNGDTTIDLLNPLNFNRYIGDNHKLENFLDDLMVLEAIGAIQFGVKHPERPDGYRIKEIK